MVEQQAINKQKGGYKQIEPRWKPGESGNPKGRPKNSVTAMLKANPEATNLVIAEKLTDMAKEGDLKAIDMYIDRTDGKVLQQTDVTFNGEGLSEVLLKLRGYSPPQLPKGEEPNATNR